MALSETKNKASPRRNFGEKSDKSFGHRYIEDEDYQAYSRQGKMGQEEPNSKGYQGVLFFEEEGDSDGKRLISRRGIHANGPYDDDDDDEDIGDDEIETEDGYFDNDDFDPETYARHRRRNSHL